MPNSVTNGSTWTYGQVFSWLTKKGEEIQQNQCLSAQNYRINEISKSNCLAFLNRPTVIETASEYMSGENDSLVNSLILDRFESVVNEAFNSYFIKTKEVDFKADFAPMTSQKTLKSIEENFNITIKDAEARKKVLPGNSIAAVSSLFDTIGKSADFKEILENISAQIQPLILMALLGVNHPYKNHQLGDRNEEVGKAIIERLLSLVYNNYAAINKQEKSSKQILTEALRLALQNLRRNIINFTPLNPIMAMAFSRLLNNQEIKKTEEMFIGNFARLLEENPIIGTGLCLVAEGSAQLDRIIKNLKDEKAIFNNNRDRHAKFIPPRTNAQKTSNGSQEQVMQQQQQQQQQSSAPKRKKNVSLDEAADNSYREITQDSLANPRANNIKRFTAPWGNSAEGIHISFAAEKLLNKITVLKGDPLF